MVWGGNWLTRLGKTFPAEVPHGESWEVSDHRLHHSLLAAGPLAGHSLRELMEQHREALLGPVASRFSVFPWLIKFLDANGWLSVQVHPDDQTAARLCPGEGGKTEVWFVLDALPGSRIYAGVLAGFDEKMFREALAAGSVADCLHSFTPRPGDCLPLPAGTVHAVGGGVLLAEMQQTSDATFRLFDWNRRDATGKPRELHLDKGLAAIDWRRGPVNPIKADRFATFEAANNTTQQPLVQTPFFQIDFYSGKVPFECRGSGRLQAFVILAGKGRLSWEDGEESVRAGQAWLLPAELSNGRFVPEPALAGLRCTFPDF
jgi:mannose-6-phosphate isomerase